MPLSFIGPSISWVPLSMSGLRPGSVCRVHIVLQELQAVALMLCRIASQLPGKAVAFWLDNSTVKSLLM